MDAILERFERWWQGIVHNNSFVQAKDYAEAAFRAGVQTSAATNYAEGMDLYGAIIALQEASRWLESGYPDHAKTNVDVALKQLYSISESEAEKKA